MVDPEALKGGEGAKQIWGPFSLDKGVGRSKGGPLFPH